MNRDIKITEDHSVQGNAVIVEWDAFNPTYQRGWRFVCACNGWTMAAHIAKELDKEAGEHVWQWRLRSAFVSGL